MKGYVSDAAFPAPQPLSHDRPPTKAEVWAYITHVYGNLITDEEELQAKAHSRWTGNYHYWVNVKGWRKQPDWVEGQPVIPEACPPGPFFHDTPYVAEIERLFKLARTRLASQTQLTLEAA